MMSVLKLAGALIALIIAVVFGIFLPGSGAEPIIIIVAGSIFSFFGWNWRTQYDEVKAWVQSKSLWAVVIVTIPIAGFLGALVFSWDLTAIQIFGFNLDTIFQYLIELGGGLFIIGATHAKVKKDRVYKKAA